MSFRKVGKAKKRVDALRVAAERLEKQAAAIRQSMEGLPSGLAEIQIRMAEMFPGRGTPEEQMRALRGGVGPGMSTGSGWAAGAEGAVNAGISIPADYSEGARQRREQRAGGWNEAAAANVIKQLEALKERLEKVFGGPVYITLLIEQEIRNIQAKVLTPDEALAFMRYVLGTMSAGLQQEALSPVASIRNVASDLLRFVGGAALPGGAGALTPGQRALPTPPTEAEAQRSVAAGIGAAVAGAVREQVVGMGATIRRHGEEQANRVLAGVGTQAKETRETAEKNHRWNLDWQQRIETGYLRPMRQGIHDQAALGATQTRELSMALERLQVSGALSGTH